MRLDLIAVVALLVFLVAALALDSAGLGPGEDAPRACGFGEC